MTDVNKAFDIVKRVNDGAVMTQDQLCELRYILNEMDRDLQLGVARERGMMADLKALAERDDAKRIAELEENLKRVTGLKECYSNTLDRAMECVEAVLPQTSHTKDEIEDRGAVFFKNATRLLPTWIRQKRDAVCDDTVSAKLAAANKEVAAMKTERNVAVRKQLDREQTIGKLQAQIAALTSTEDRKRVEQQAQRISELSVECDRLLRTNSDVRTMADGNAARAHEAIKRCEDVERIAGAQITDLTDQLEKKQKRIDYLSSISPGQDSESVSTLILACRHLMTPSACDDRKQAVQAVVGMAIRYPDMAKHYEEARDASEKYAKWLDAIGRHLQLDQMGQGQWWERSDALERLRVRVEFRVLLHGATHTRATVKWGKTRVAKFDALWNRLYDWADRNLVWIKTF